MEMIPRVLFGKVMHKRFFPKMNEFLYGIYYILLPIPVPSGAALAVDRFSPLSFYVKDHGDRAGGDLKKWIGDILSARGIAHDLEILLLAMPRVLGYVFNPVSFWLCFDRDKQLRAVLCEVNNTFGETHSYLCAHQDGRPIDRQDEIFGEKFFHVSPFLERQGEYKFRFHAEEGSFGAWIDHYDAEGRLQLQTALTGRLEPMTAASLRRAFWRYPLVTLKAVALIHWQAAKLLAKGVRYVPKPFQNKEKLTAANIKKM